MTTEEKKTRKPRKTAAEKLAEIEAQREKALAQIAQEKALEIPGVADLITAMESAKKTQTESARKFSGPQSFESRREGYRLWNVEIDASEALATAEKDFSATVHDYFKAEIARLVQEITNGDISADDIEDSVSEVIENQPTDEIIDELRLAESEAREARKAFTEAKKQPKRKKKEDGADSDEISEVSEA